MLSINNLFVTVDHKEVVKGVSLTIRPGEIHALMGPNGSGKSSLAMTLAGHPRYQIKNQKSKIKNTDQIVKILLDGGDISDKTPDERARMGLFLAMQYPVGVEGITVEQLLRRSLQEKLTSSQTFKDTKKPTNVQTYKNTKKSNAPNIPNITNNLIDVLAFRKQLEQLAKKVGVSKELLHRSLNVGFSGGEKKRLEILQMLVLQPKYAILDETDSGLDIDALRIIATAVKHYVSARGTKRVARGNGHRASRNKPPAILVITHYARLLKYLKPDVVHIMKEGKIIRSGSKRLAQIVEEKGYQISN